MAGLIDIAAGRIADILAARRTTDPRSPDESRVGWSGRTLAGVSVTPDSAVQIATVWACLRYLSQTVAMLPWRVMHETDNGSELAKNHRIDWLLHKRPNPDWGAFQFRETLVHWALRWGNGYAEIERDAIGVPVALWPLHPERVDPQRDADGRLVFEVNNGTGARTILPAADMFHIRGFGEGPVGVNVIAYAAESIGWARAAQLFGAAFFGNGMNVAGVVQVKNGMQPEGLARLKQELKALYAGGPRNANKWAVIDNGSEFKAIGIEPEKAQFISTNQHLVEEICRWFGVPPHKVMHLLRATFSNIEHQSIEVVQDSILPWVKRFEEEADYKLFGQNRRGYYTKMNLRALLRGDFKSQQEGLEIMRRQGVINADEWRDFVDMNRLPVGAGGDKYAMQAQYTTLERIGQEPAKPEPRRGDNGGPPHEEDEDAPADLVDRIGRLRSATHG